MFTPEIKQSIDQSVLCWLATVSNQGVPNVSPKELFVYDGDRTLLIANIASPKSVLNIQQNSKVCVSFVEVFRQKGFKLIGKAHVIEKTHDDFMEKRQPLYDIAGDHFPIHGVITIEVNEVAEIIAPSYKLFPETTEQDQIESAMKTYGVQPLINVS